MCVLNQSISECFAMFDVVVSWLFHPTIYLISVDFDRMDFAFSQNVASILNEKFKLDSFRPH